MTKFQVASEPRSIRYVELFRTIYRITNFWTSSSLTTRILQTLFVGLEDDALAFLAGIWVGSTETIRQDNELRTVALFHAAAFLEVHTSEDSGIDFQTILPALLLALQSPVVDQRQMAFTCIAHLQRSIDHKFKFVYGFDTIYGKNTGRLTP